MHDNSPSTADENQVCLGPSLTAFQRDLRRRRHEYDTSHGLVRVALALPASVWEAIRWSCSRRAT